MKLITNTVEEAKQNICISVKENFEPETVFDVTMKDIDERVVPNGIVNSKIDPSLIKHARTVIGTEVLLNGFKSSVDVEKPVLENGTSKASSDYYEDVSDEDEKVRSKVKENGVSNPKETSVGKTESEKCGKLIVDGNSEKVTVNGCTSSGIEMKGKRVENKNDVDDKSEKLNIKSGGKDMLFEFNANDFVVIDSVEVSTSEDDFDKSISEKDVGIPQGKKPSTPKLGKETSVDEGSDTENDLEAKEKLLALLKETPPAQVIMPEEEIETENISGSFAEEEKRLLSLLEDSQSECNLNLSNDTVSSSSTISDIDKTSDDQTKTSDSVNESEIKSEIMDSEKAQVNKSADNEKCNPIVNDKDVLDSGDTDDSVVIDKSINKTSTEKSDDEKDKLMENDGLEKVGVEESMIADNGDDVEIMKPLILVEEVNESSDSSKDKKELADDTALTTSENIVSDSVDCEKKPIDKDDNMSSNNEALMDGDEKSDTKKCNSKRRLEDVDLGTTKKLKRSTSCDGKRDIVLRKRTNSLDLDTKNVAEDGNKKFKPAFVKDPCKKSDDDDDVVQEINECDSITIDEDESDDDGHQKTGKQDDEQEKESSETESVINSDNAKTSNFNDDRDKGKTVEMKDVEKVEDVKVDENNEPKVEVSDKIKDDSNVDSKDTTKTGLTAKEAKDSLKYVNRNLPLMKRIHKEKLKTLDKSDLEELIIQKICESIADRSVIGELRLKVRSLEKSVDVWRKKAATIDKANRELKSIFNRYLKEVDDNIGGNSKTVVPIRITRSVGLQVAPPQVSEKSKPPVRTPVPAPPPKQNEYIRTLRPTPSVPNRDPNLPVQKSPPVSAPLRTPNSVTPTNTPVRTIGPKSVMQKQAAAVAAAAATAAATAAVNNNNFNVVRRLPTNQHNEPLSPASVANKRVINTTPPSVPVPAANPSSSSDLEVIDLTDKDERTARGVLTANNLRIMPRQIVPSPSPSGATLTSPVGQRMTYLVPTSMQAVQGNQRQQLILATTTTNSAQIRPVTTAIPVNRANNVNQTLTIPGAVIMKNGTVMPIQTQPTNVAIRSPNPSSLAPPRRVQQVRVAQNVLQQSQPLTHPAPLPTSPNQPNQPGWLLSPPRPLLKVSKTENGIMLSWSMTLGKHFEEIASYQLYAYQENTSVPPNSSLWKKVGDVKALPLPMACTLTQFVEGHKYHFAVRAVDVHSRVGLFSYPSTILLK